MSGDDTADTSHSLEKGYIFEGPVVMGAYYTETR